MNAAKEAIAAAVPTNFVDITTVASEAEVPCRSASALPFIAANGIFTNVKKETITVTILGRPVEVVLIELKLNPAHRIKPGAAVPGCNMDGVLFLPAKSVNVSQVAEPQYIRAGTDPANPNAVTSVQLAFTRSNRTKPATLGIRVKFEEGVGQTPQFNPKRSNGTVTFP
jgi:hypothetical protein